MRIGIDARMIDESGIGRYIGNLLTQLGQLDQENDYYVFLLKSYYDRLEYHSKNFNKVLADFRWYTITEQIKLPLLLNSYHLDLVHFPHFNVPVFYPGKFIVTIHDLIHQHYHMSRATTLDPLTYLIKRLGYDKVFRNAVNKAQKILVPSNFVKGQVVNDWSVDENKIVVTPEAVARQLVAIATHCTQVKINRVLRKFKIKPPFIFYVGNAHPHKNVEGLIRTFFHLKRKYKYLQLVLSGADHYFWQRIKSEFMDSRLRRNDKDVKDIIFTGFVSDEELVALYKSAQCFVMPSFEEGFGIPLLEAMACECPVVSSNAGSLPEVGADAVIYFDPYNIDDMTQRMTQVLNSAKLRKELIEKGLKRYQQFSWRRLTVATSEVYQKVLGKNTQLRKKA